MELLMDYIDFLIDIMDPLLDFPHRCHGSPYRFALDYMDPFIGYMGSPYRLPWNPF